MPKCIPTNVHTLWYELCLLQQLSLDNNNLYIFTPLHHMTLLVVPTVNESYTKKI